MLYNSLQFLVFFIVVTIWYFNIPHRFRWLLLLVASCYFYMAFVPKYIVILGFTIVIDYIAGIYLEKFEGRKKKLFLIASLIANIGILGAFKYHNFFNENLDNLLGWWGQPTPLPFLQIALPIGLSFHTFQAMSYTIEVYRGNQKAERHFGVYALYVMFYPQLVAGPIERPQNVLHQFHEKHDFDKERFKNGLMQMAWGFFKKVVIADRLALIVDPVYANSEQYNGLTICVATIAYAFQIYCDFSGYSDIGIGAARIMGYDLMKNFESPYLSRSISEFWRRWHMSLSSWFRDYLYIPLGGNREGRFKTYFNLFFVFFISGLWHGANWTFIVWGSLHGLFLIAENMVGVKVDKHLQILSLKTLFLQLPKVIYTFVLVCFAWVFFRSSNLYEAIGILKGMSTISVQDVLNTSFNIPELLFCILAIAILLIKEYKFSVINIKSDAWCAVVIVSMFFACYLFGVFGTHQFIYFQF
jgi:alginate O-acetyltransferase complex protein AlgI